MLTTWKQSNLRTSSVRSPKRSKKLVEKLICLSRCLFSTTQSPTKNVQHPGFVLLAELALQSDNYIETCDPYREKHSCRCYVLFELDKTASMLLRHFDVKDATHKANTSNTQSITIMNVVCMGTTYDQTWIVRESENLGSPSSPACLRAFVDGWTRLAGWPVLVRCDRWTYNGSVFVSTLANNGVSIRPARLEVPEQIGRAERRGAMLKKMMSKVIKDTLQAENRWISANA